MLTAAEQLLGHTPDNTSALCAGPSDLLTRWLYGFHCCAAPFLLSSLQFFAQHLAARAMIGLGLSRRQAQGDWMHYLKTGTHRGLTRLSVHPCKQLAAPAASLCSKEKQAQLVLLWLGLPQDELSSVG